MRKNKNIKKSNLKALLRGIISGLFISFVLIIICAFFMTKKDINLMHIKYIWIGISLISGFVTGIISGKNIINKGFLWGGLSALIVSFLILIFIALLNRFSLNLFSFSIILFYLISGVTGGIAARNI